MAQNEIGYCYEHGFGVTQNSKNAFIWYQKSAMQGNINAQHNLGFLYYTGKDYENALKWFVNAAERGHAGAQNNIGVIYECLGYKDKALEYYERCGDYENAQNRVAYIKNN